MRVEDDGGNTRPWIDPAPGDDELDGQVVGIKRFVELRVVATESPQSDHFDDDDIECVDGHCRESAEQGVPED